MCQNKTHKSLESLEQSLDRVNAWIGNCDQKAGFLLGKRSVKAVLQTHTFILYSVI